LRFKYPDNQIGVLSCVEPVFRNRNLERHRYRGDNKIFVSRPIARVKLSPHPTSVQRFAPTSVHHRHQPLFVVDVGFVFLNRLEDPCCKRRRDKREKVLTWDERHDTVRIVQFDHGANGEHTSTLSKVEMCFKMLHVVLSVHHGLSGKLRSRHPVRVRSHRYCSPRLSRDVPSVSVNVVLDDDVVNGAVLGRGKDDRDDIVEFERFSLNSIRWTS
jgi:hypothetical protein